jgi:hypothetical protein
LQSFKASRTQQTPPEPPPPLTTTAPPLDEIQPEGWWKPSQSSLMDQNQENGLRVIRQKPTSLKVKCAGQIKVKHKASSCKNWQEIERIHNSRKCTKESAISRINESAIQVFKFILF